MDDDWLELEWGPNSEAPEILYIPKNHTTNTRPLEIVFVGVGPGDGAVLIIPERDEKEAIIVIDACGRSPLNPNNSQIITGSPRSTARAAPWLLQFSRDYITVRTKIRRPRTNGFVERMDRTLLNELWRDSQGETGSHLDLYGRLPMARPM